MPRRAPQGPRGKAGEECRVKPTPKPRSADAADIVSPHNNVISCQIRPRQGGQALGKEMPALHASALRLPGRGHARFTGAVIGPWGLKGRGDLRGPVENKERRVTRQRRHPGSSPLPTHPSTQPFNKNSRWASNWCQALFQGSVSQRRCTRPGPSGRLPGRSRALVTGRRSPEEQGPLSSKQEGPRVPRRPGGREVQPHHGL